ncbi:MAG: helix-turn-helix transcriptional regulator [Bacteroidaceae bacterium]
MPTNKNAQLRYQILDRCFSDFGHRYFIGDLQDKVNEVLLDLYGTEVSVRQIREDIKYMKDRVTFHAPIETYPYDGRKCYYRYSKRDFSIFNNELSASEVASLRSTIDMLSRFRGIPTNAWLEEVISNLEFRFGIRPNPEKVVSFEHNDQLKGTEFLGELIDSTLNHQPLMVVYRTFAGNERASVIHPYHIKQFNNRWFLIGLQIGHHGNYITNKALDRIVKFSHANVPFISNKDIDFNQYFQDIVGVTLPEEHPHPEEVLLKFHEDRFPYVVNKPIHPSQKVVSEQEHIIRLLVRPNKELEARIFSYGPQVEVLAPQWLRNQVREKLQTALRKYSTQESDAHDE